MLHDHKVSWVNRPDDSYVELSYGLRITVHLDRTFGCWRATFAGVPSGIPFKTREDAKAGALAHANFVISEILWSLIDVLDPDSDSNGDIPVPS